MPRTLTPREAQILAGLARGETYAQIAARLHLTPATMKGTVERLRFRHGVGTGEELVHLGYTWGWLTALPPEPRQAVALSGRQREVLQHIATGLTNEQIAVRLGISPSTVIEYGRRLRHALDAHNRPHLVALAHQHGHLIADTAIAA